MREIVCRLEGKETRVHANGEGVERILQRISAKERLVSRIEGPVNLHWTGKVSKAADDHPVEFPAKSDGVVPAQVAAVILYLLVVLIGFLWSQEIGSLRKLPDFQVVRKTLRR